METYVFIHLFLNFYAFLNFYYKKTRGIISHWKTIKYKLLRNICLGTKIYVWDVYKVWTNTLSFILELCFLMKLIVDASENGFWPREFGSSSGSLTEVQWSPNMPCIQSLCVWQLVVCDRLNTLGNRFCSLGESGRCVRDQRGNV